MIRWCFTVALLIALGSVGSPAVPSGKGLRARPSTRAVRIVDKGPRHRFLYSYPALAAAIPALDRALRGEARRELTDLLNEIRIPAAGVNYPMTYEQEWAITANTPDLLAMSSIGAAYWGGAHGLEGYRTMLWGKAGRRPLAFGDLFSRPQAALARLTREFCPAFTRKRADRRREEGEAVPAPLPCPNAARVAIVPLARRGTTVDRFRMMLTGDDILDGRPGGSYEIDIGVSPAIRALVRPQFSASFARATG
jgi:hypothetical protein